MEFQKYKLCELAKIKKVNGRPLKEYKEGSIPYVTGTRSNNGIIGYVDAPTEAISKGNCIAIDPISGFCTYQAKDFVGRGFSGASINLLYIDNLERLSALYIITIIQKHSTQAASYGDLFNSKRLASAEISLPTLPQKDTSSPYSNSGYMPDFSYMKNYMKNVEVTVSSSLTKLQSAKNSSHKTCVLDWKRFSMINLGFSIYHGTRIKKSDRIDGNTIFVTAGKENQGVIGKIGNSVSEWLDPITVDMFGNCFYHNYKCFGDDNIYAFINNNLNKYHKWFIASVINAENSAIFSYANQFRQNDADKLSVMLPQTSSGEPDWDYMEQYMKNIEISANNSLNMLQSALN